jgi:AcrR family transcriptional regulator
LLFPWFVDTRGRLLKRRIDSPPAHVYDAYIKHVLIVNIQGTVVPEKIRSAKPQPYHHGDLRRTLIETALQLVTEEQDWTFSLREVARRAGVSPHAPYNHFPEKLDLLAAAAAVGFERLRDGMRGAMVGLVEAEVLLAAICRTYVRHGLENPALYRLMFGPALSNTGSADRPKVAKLAGDQARAVLEEVVLHGARSGAFAVSPDDPQDLELAALSTWSATHGLTMLVIDKIPKAGLLVDDLIERMLRMIIAGLVRPGIELSARSPLPAARAGRGKVRALK